MTEDEAYQAGRTAAAAGFELAGFPVADALFRAWLRGFRECQSFDPGCIRCGGTGRMRVESNGDYSSAELVCSCNVGRRS